MTSWQRWAIVAAGFLVTFGSVLSVLTLRHMQETMDLLVLFQAKETVSMSTMTSQWVSGGVERTFTTHQQEGESDDDHATRHKSGVEAMLEVFPPDK